MVDESGRLDVAGLDRRSRDNQLGFAVGSLEDDGSHGTSPHRRRPAVAAATGDGDDIQAPSEFHRIPHSRWRGDVLTSTTTNNGVSLNLSWEVDLWGRLRAGEAAALADVMASSADLRAARLSLAAQTARGYFAVIEARTQAELARETLDNQRLAYAQIRERYERGLRPSLDLRLGRSSTATAEAALHQRDQMLDFARRQLESLLGRYPGALLRASAQLPQLSEQVPVGLPSELIRRRPDLVAAERRLAAADARLVQARRALYPRISLTASSGRSSEELADLLKGDFSVWNLAANLTQPLFQGGRLRGGVDMAVANVDGAVAAFAQSVLRALGEVEGALAAEGYLALQEAALAISAERGAGRAEAGRGSLSAGTERPDHDVGLATSSLRGSKPVHRRPSSAPRQQAGPTSRSRRGVRAVSSE